MKFKEQQEKQLTFLNNNKHTARRSCCRKHTTQMKAGRKHMHTQAKAEEVLNELC
jgi:hypothetical protein